MNHIEAMKQALEALEDCYSTGGDNGQPLYQFYDDDLVNAAITTLRTAIEQAEKQEPVGEVVVESMGVRGSDAMQVRIHFYKEVPPVGSKVYTTPPAAPVQEPVAAKDWEGAEYWMPLAWELCADECGEDACNDLIWEGAPIPEPWGERWLKYEDEAKRLIALVQKHTTPPAAQRQWVGLTDEEIDQGLLRSDYALQTAHAWRAGVVFAMTKLKEKNNG